MSKAGKPKPRKKKSSAAFEDGDSPDQCRARAKSTQERCGRKKEHGFNVCRYHGAHGGRPVIHGRYSTRLGRLSEAYNAALEDTDALMDVRNTMALLDVRVQRAAEMAGECDTPEFRARAQSLFQRAATSQDPEETGRLLTELGHLLDLGASESSALTELTDAAEKLAVRQERAWGIRLSAAQAINARDLVTVLARFADIVIQEADGNAARRILERIDLELMENRDGQHRVAAPRGS